MQRRLLATVLLILGVVLLLIDAAVQRSERALVVALAVALFAAVIFWTFLRDPRRPE